MMSLSDFKKRVQRLDGVRLETGARTRGFTVQVDAAAALAVDGGRQRYRYILVDEYQDTSHYVADAPG